ncbi:putative heavy metal-associated domain, HMA, heavy metal-associated domain superfamily [Helianthus annuus]|nr:putative heavy metal-associated domain, HMA, heavy metal-associated domain superfamily [Helianthus annuus]KAJ0892006.1 putative heavy metal-associated domain, HMA, heavy metal-associated domain superfamily [Helianthus annuus]
MHQKIEVEVNMHCEKCRTDVLKSVTKLSGIDQVSVDLGKQVLVVVGDDVDPVSVVEHVKKTGKRAKIISVGPSKKPDPPYVTIGKIPVIPYNLNNYLNFHFRVYDLILIN